MEEDYKNRLKFTIFSRNYGWYLAKITASIENFNNIIATDLETLRHYNLTPGNYVKIKYLIKGLSMNKIIEKFVILPYFKELSKNTVLIQNLLKELTKNTFNVVNENYLAKYIGELLNVMNDFSHETNIKKGMKLGEVLEFDEPGREMKIAMPESWLNKNSVDLGETVLLRNDDPSPLIL